MALHFHGLPLTPFAKLDSLAGKHVCISHATALKSNVGWAAVNAQSIMHDNGGYSIHTRGGVLDISKFYRWVEPTLGHPNWAVVPDRIAGDVGEQRRMLKTWPFDRSLGAPVWHLDKPLDYLLELIDEWPKVCLGSSAQYWKIRSPAWTERMDEVFDFLLCKRQTLPWIHGLRMLSLLGGQYPLASGDSVNVARNAHRGYCPGCKSHRIDTANGPIKWPGSIWT